MTEYMELRERCLKMAVDAVAWDTESDEDKVIKTAQKFFDFVVGEDNATNS